MKKIFLIAIWIFLLLVFPVIVFVDYKKPYWNLKDSIRFTWTSWLSCLNSEIESLERGK
jgi:hypothetical protein